MKPIRWVVAGLGHFAQTAVLPAFPHARSAQLVGLASSDERKRNVLARKYGVGDVSHVDDLSSLLQRSRADALYIVAPNHAHADLTVEGAKAGVHVLCEKPMAPTEGDCRRMIEETRLAGVRLMIAYRLHFEPANMAVVKAVTSHRIGEVRSVVSSFTFQLSTRNVRTVPTDEGGGPLWDIGVYCINAARYIFRAEPTLVTAVGSSPREGRFRAIEEQTSVILQFPGGGTATFNVGFGAAPTSWYEVVGTSGSIRLDPGYTHSGPLELVLRNADGRRGRPRVFAVTDQVAGEMEYFARCIRHDRPPEPSGAEGLADVRVVRAALESARTGRAVPLAPATKVNRPGPHQIERIRATAPGASHTPLRAQAPKQSS